MLRDYRAADLITLANGGAGMAAVLAMMSYLVTAEDWRVYLSLALVLVALLLDIADGKVARRRGEHSPFGQELDSLADIVSFGVAPAALGYRLGPARRPRYYYSDFLRRLRHQPVGAL